MFEISCLGFLHSHGRAGAPEWERAADVLALLHTSAQRSLEGLCSLPSAAWALGWMQTAVVLLGTGHASGFCSAFKGHDVFTHIV